MPEQPTAKSRFLSAYQREHATTSKVLRALPDHQSNFRPHERSSDAHALAWTFVVEEQRILLALQNKTVLGSPRPKAPEKWETILHDFDHTYGAVMHELQDAGNPSLAGTIEFFVAPKQTGHIPLDEFLWFMLYDQIHHRGQLSVYVRMTGGKVPSIYGPSADEPWL
ncbi:MAG TPA: DinB family protein [Gemmatimonadaceae bacterium]